MQFELNLGTGIIRSYRRLGYRAWYALAEFIDNSTQSFAEHKAELAHDTPPLEIAIDYDRDHLRISDNAMGMHREELDRALKLGEPPVNRTGRSEYGLGLKTAACWFGDYWTVTTKRFGDPLEYEVTIDVEKIAAGDTKLPTRVTEKTGDAIKKHYTIIDIKKIHHKYHPSTMKRIEMYIKSMYRLDLQNADFFITINGGQPLTNDLGFTFLRQANGAEYRREFDEVIAGKRVRGWMGILNPGERRTAGIAVIRRGRAIKGQPDAWRPPDIYGIQRNDLLNQRLVGEIHLDDFGISHTKDEILWMDDEEQEVEKYLADKFKDYIQVARKPRKDVGDQAPGPSPAEIQLGLSELRQQMETPEFADLITLQEVPTPDLVKVASAPLIATAKREEPAQVIKIGKGDQEVTCQIHVNSIASPNDPYFAANYATNVILVSVNTQHPHFRRVRGGSHGVNAYFMECVYDALAEWKAMKANTVRHDTIKILKDGLLRHEVAMDATDDYATARETVEET